MTKAILIAVDGSPPAEEAINVGLGLATAQGASAIFVHFSPLAAPLVADSPLEGPSQEAIEAADEVLAAAAEQARARGVDFELVIYDEHGTSEIAESIAGIAAGSDAGMVVVGTRGRGAITGAVLGSVSHRLLAISPLPVVAVHVAKTPDTTA